MLRAAATLAVVGAGVEGCLFLKSKIFVLLQLA